MPLHSDLTGTDLHEPKGVEGANQYEVYIADGAGSGAWGLLTPSSLSGANTNLRFISAVLPDVSASSSILIPITDACTINEIYFVLGNAITVANASVTVTRTGGGSLGSAVTILYSSSAEGDEYVFTPSSNNNFSGTGTQYLKIASDGGSTDTAPLYILVRLSLT